MTNQLNRGFSSGIHCPFRFFLIGAAEGSSWLGLTYHHAVADAWTAALLLEKTLEAAANTETPAFAGKPTLYHPPLRRLFPAELGLRRAPALLVECARDHQSFRRCHLPPYGDGTDPTVHFEVHGLHYPVAELRSLARDSGTTIQDILFAALLEALGTLYPEQTRPIPKRKMLAVATAIDLRRNLGDEMANSLGQFVSSYSVHHPVPDQIEFPQLLADVAEQTARTKRRRLYFAHSWNLRILARLWPFLTQRRKHRSGWKYSPLMAGISNSDLTEIFSGHGPRSYLRAASTGPAMPLLVDLTTVGNSFSLTTIHRNDALSTGTVRDLVEQVQERLGVRAAGLIA